MSWLIIVPQGRISSPIYPKQPIKGIFRDPPEWDRFMVSFPYYSHIFRDSYGSGMEIVGGTYHKGVPFLGVPENATEPRFSMPQGDQSPPISTHPHTCVAEITLRDRP